MKWSRIFHWGPIITMVLVLTIACSTMFCLSVWWPPNSSLPGALNAIFFVGNVILILVNYFHASAYGPGFVRRAWKPKRAADSKFLQYCSVCCGYKPPRSHHCSSCRRCVMKMDHHCPWINCCVGHENHASFTRFVFHAPLGCFHAFLLQSYFVYDLMFDETSDLKFNVEIPVNGLMVVILGIGLSLGVALSVSILLYYQLCNILNNQTAIEEWIVCKASNRRDKDDEPFIYPYNLGWQRNWKQVIGLFWYPVGDGIHWPVREGCDQFTLTREQLEQKRLKRDATRHYVCVRKYNGWLVPLQFGLMTCVRVPWDTGRLRVEPSDNVLVTRWRKGWLYGEKVERLVRNGDAVGRTGGLAHPLERFKGWLPEKCLKLVEKEE